MNDSQVTAPRLAIVNTTRPVPPDIESWQTAVAHLAHTLRIDVRTCLSTNTPTAVRAALGVVA